MKAGTKRTLKFIGGSAVALVTIWLTFRKTDWNELGAVLSASGWGYALAVLPMLAASYLFRIYRWVTLLAPMGRVRKATAAPPLLTGFMLNSVFPGRLGEFARSALLARRTSMPFPSVFATVVVARLFDGLALTGLALVVMGAMWSSLSSPVRGGLIAAGCGYAAILGILVALRRWHERTSALLVWPLRKAGAAGIADRIQKALLDFARGLDILKDPGELFRVILLSAGVWLTLCVSVIPVFMALGMQWSWYYPALVLVLAGFGMLIPTPAGTGTIHYALGVVYPAVTGVPEAQAKAMAIFFHATQFLPIIIAGLAAYRGNLKDLDGERGTEAGSPL